MKHAPARPGRGFTLIELMVVLVIIGVMCAVAVPTMISVNQRKTLSGLVTDIYEAAMMARTRSLQTRNAAVLEVRATAVWVNVLSGSSCLSPAIAQRCVMPRVGGAFINLASDDLTGAQARMCGGAAMTVVGTTCTATPLVQATGFALCFDGRGELWVRASADDNTACASAGAPTITAGTWARSCGSATASASVTPLAGSNINLFDGALVVFNRVETANCSGAALDVRQGLIFPSSGSPFTQVTP